MNRKEKTVSLTHGIHVELQYCSRDADRLQQAVHTTGKIRCFFFPFETLAKGILIVPMQQIITITIILKDTLSGSDLHRTSLSQNSPTWNRGNGSKQYQLHYKLWLSALALTGSKYTLYKYPLQALKNVFGWNNPTSQDTETVKNEGPVLGSAGNNCRLSHFGEEGTDGSRFCKSDLKKSKQGWDG